MKKLIIGNWKMNMLSNEIETYAIQFETLLRINPINCDYGFAIPSLYLSMAIEKFNKLGSRAIIAAQNCNAKKYGAYTGEVSYSQLLDIGVKYSIIGHSERRVHFNETNSDINLKIVSLLKNKMIPILCVGENKTQREDEKHFEVVTTQIQEAFEGIESAFVENIIIAYEPVWAIGTGKFATETDAENMCKHIREILVKLFTEEVANKIYILYGGSVDERNAILYMSQPNINGALVGGASLDAKKFIELLKAV